MWKMTGMPAFRASVIQCNPSADVQRELNRLQNMGDTGPALMDLLHQKQTMIRALEAMKPPKELQ